MTRLLGCCLLFVAAGAGVARSEPVAKQLNWAERMFGELEYDFGTVPRGADARHRIVITNIYGEAIKLQSPTTSCKCTTPALSTNVLQPNERGYLELKLDTVGHHGSKSPRIEVPLSFGKSQVVKVQIQVRAMIRDDVTISQEVVDFGRITAGKPVQRSVTVNYHGSAPWKITGLREQLPGVGVEIGQPQRMSQGLTYRLNLTLGNDLPVGAFDRSLVILTEEPTRSYFTLRVRGTVEPKFVVLTPVIKLNPARPGETLPAKVVLRSEQPFSLEGVHASNGYTTASISGMTEKTVQVLPLTIRVPDDSGPFSDELEIRIEGEAKPVTCRIEGRVVEIPDAAAVTLSTTR